MISALLMFPVLSQGKGGAIEAVIAAVLERINGTDGSVCHEETIGDYATWTNQQNNITSTAPLCANCQIDQDYYLPVLTQRYFVNSSTGSQRTANFFKYAFHTLIPSVSLIEVAHKQASSPIIPI